MNECSENFSKILKKIKGINKTQNRKITLTDLKNFREVQLQTNEAKKKKKISDLKEQWNSPKQNSRKRILKN